MATTAQPENRPKSADNAPPDALVYSDLAGGKLDWLWLVAGGLLLYWLLYKDK